MSDQDLTIPVERVCRIIQGGPLDGAFVGAAQRYDGRPVFTVGGHFYALTDVLGDKRFLHLDPLRCPLCDGTLSSLTSHPRLCLRCRMSYPPQQRIGVIAPTPPTT
jgi:hypothetical protein